MLRHLRTKICQRVTSVTSGVDQECRRAGERRPHPTARAGLEPPRQAADCGGRKQITGRVIERLDW